MEISRINEFLSDGYGNGYGDSYDNGNGYGYGYGDGDGYGNGYGNGYGDGDGDGDSYGNSNGDGDGYGNGNGDGYGNGNGDGDSYGNGNGDGNGHGYGNGHGIKSINNNLIFMVDEIPTIIKSIHKNVAKGFIVKNGLQLTQCYIVKGNGYFAHGDSVKDAMTSLEEKICSNLNEDEAISMFLSKFELNKKYPNSEFFKWHNILTGSCRFGREEFAKTHNIDVENGEMTVDEFIKLTENAYGGSVIKELKNKIKRM